MYIYLHNPRCSKSRAWLELMKNSGKKFVLRDYLKNPLDIDELQDLQEKLGKKAIEFTRTKEDEFASCWLSLDSTDIQIFKKMQGLPKLLERPIVYNEKKAFIGRPVDELLKIFRK